MRVEFAAEGFLAAMRREFLKQNPDADSPVRDLWDYSPAHRSILMKGILEAIRRAGSEKDDAFAVWCEKRSVSTE